MRGGVIVFETFDVTLGFTDLFVYVIATNTLYQITNMPSVHEGTPT